MRSKFNDGGFWEMARDGRLAQEIKRCRPASAQVDQPEGTVSHNVHYVDRHDEEVARIHRFVLPDGRLGGSGRPDPKRLLCDGVIYRLIQGTE